MKILSFPGDKSIAHRLVLISLLLDKPIRITNLPNGKDVVTSINIVKQLGVKATQRENYLELTPPLKKEYKEEQILDCGNSGTTARLLCGILANLIGSFTLVGDSSLSKRPMERVVKPLTDLMGLDIKDTNGHLPIRIKAVGKTKACVFNNLTGSAQVKSAVLFSGLAANGETNVLEEIQSRDHTERLLAYFKRIKSDNHFSFQVPGDISSASFFIILSAINGEKLCIKDICLNSTRIGFLSVLERMGAKIEKRITSNLWEPVGDLIIEGGNLIATDIEKSEIPSLIDELPILAIAMCFAKGKSRVSGAKELRVKESDRISCLISQLKIAGVDCSEQEDGYEIQGGNQIKDCLLDSFCDHRLAMAFEILAKASSAKIEVLHKEAISISFPNFNKMLWKP